MSKINIVLYKPEIPGNTANIIRTCVGLNATLHLIKPYGFDLDLSTKVFKRGSTNYTKEVELIEYENFDEFIEKNGD
ncbi:MAG: tRNA (cytidine(34)-2'-O)-methyltransferase, partial [Spiroplasma sp.]|nr:tRNA (cytidine(34)-2'-O)-methyltransferase [Mycoplasmatales bacterium]